MTTITQLAASCIAGGDVMAQVDPDRDAKIRPMRGFMATNFCRLLTEHFATLEGLHHLCDILNSETESTGQIWFVDSQPMRLNYYEATIPDCEF